MPRYLLLLRDENVDAAAMSPEEWQLLFHKFVAWAERLQGEGRLRGVERLLSDGGRTVRSRAGAVVVDGPYVEGKEQVLGFFVVEAETVDEAARIAAECPSVPQGGSVEIRVIGDFPKPR